MVEGSGGDSLGGISRLRHHRVGGRAQKKGVVRDKAFRRQPQVVLAPQIEGVVDPDSPDTRGGLYKAHDNELASGAGLRHLIVQINHCIFQDKGNALLGEGMIRNTADLLPCRGEKADGEQFWLLRPKLQGEAGLALGHTKLRVLKFRVRPDGSEEMVAVSSFIASGRHCDNAGKIADSIQILGQRGGSLVASQVCSQGQQNRQGKPFCPGKGQQIFHSHHDIVFLIGLGRIREHIVIPQILFGRL